MEPVLSDPVLQFRPDTVRAVRALYGLDAPGRMEDAVRILDDWVRMQPHFKKKDFSKRYLEAMVVASKGSVERAKSKLDKYCTIRTLVPKFFDRYHARNDLSASRCFENFEIAVIPKMTQDYHRVMLVALHTQPSVTDSSMADVYKYACMLIEYIKVHDYPNGLIFVIDYLDANLMELIPKINLSDMTQWFAWFTEGFGMRIKSINIISNSRMIEVMVTLFKKALSAKIGERIRVLDSLEKLSEVVDKKILPAEYGGEERSMKTLCDDMLEAISSKEHVEYLKMMSEATTDEAYRLSDDVTDEVMGIAGTFRTLNVD